MTPYGFSKWALFKPGLEMIILCLVVAVMRKCINMQSNDPSRLVPR